MRLKLKIIWTKYSVLSLSDVCMLLKYRFICLLLRDENIFIYLGAKGDS